MTLSETLVIILFQVQPRPSTVAKEVVVVIGGISQDSTFLTQTVEMYDPQRDRWLSLPEFPRLTGSFSATVLNNCIYVTGGIVDGSIVAHVWRFDACRRTWKEVQPMLKPRAHHSSAVLEDRLYVVGGVRYEMNKMLNIETIECYNCATNCWTAAGRTMFPRKQSRLVPYNSTIVEVGGLQAGDAQVDTMTSYHIVGDMIKPTGEQFVLPKVIQFAQIVVLESIFYILWEENKEFIALDAARRTFRRLPSPRYARKHCGAVVAQGRIYMVGGYIDSKPSRVVECFDPTSNTWTLEKELKEGRAMHGCVKLEMS
jgi:N-acetylneuraminic acid mutarotase